jgi:hypothetical protein
MLKIFGACVALVTIPAGLVVIFSEMQGAGPCGRFCGILTSLLNVFGQSAYNVIYGSLLVVIGIGFAGLSFSRRGERGPADHDV